MTAEIRPQPPARSRSGAPSAAAATAASRPVPGSRRAAPAPRPRPELALVDRRALRTARLRRRLLGLFTVVLVVAMFTVGLVQAQLVQRQQHLDELRAEITRTQAQRLRLERDVVVASSPAEIVRRATELGMVRAEDPVYLVAVRPAVDG